MLKSEMSEKIEMLKTHFGTTNHEKIPTDMVFGLHNQLCVKF